MNNHLNIPFLRECFDLDQENWTLIWRRRPREHFATERAYKAWNSRFPGTDAGTDHGNSNQKYKQIRVRGVSTMLHRVIWALYYGQEPQDYICHNDGNPYNNNINNLREVSRSEMHQLEYSQRNTSLAKGLNVQGFTRFIG